MFLKCIEMTGFKSFPEKTQMQLAGSIIGVVGPNGSGKSNVSDAVRWVLGEQSARNLRGGMMQDVIFAGTQTRKPRSFCEVTLLFDNSERRFGSDYTEIEVTRKLYRSGESEYYINHTKCRLKDILELFRDTGVGKEGYSIIGQGRIDEILSDKSLDRRRVFEEASGIMKYRVRKEEAERKLERTRLNLVRVDDILREQAFLLEPLKVQADDAAVYLELAARLKTLDVNLFLRAYDKSKEKIARLEQQKKALEEERAEKQSLLEQLSAKLTQQQEGARQIEEAGGALAERLSLCMAELERIEGEVRLCDERIQNNEKDSQRIAREIEEAEQKATDIVTNEKTNLSRMAQIEQEIGKQKQAASEAAKQLEALSGDSQDRMRIIEAVQSEKVEAIEKIADVRSAITAIEAQQQSQQQRRAEMQTRIASLIDEKAKAQEAVFALDESLKKLSDKAAGLRTAFNEAVQRERSVAAKLSGLRDALEETRREHAACLSSVRFISDIKNSFEGYAESVKRLMIAANQDVSLGKLIRGTVADMISVPAKFETAIETCLGGALQNIIVGNEYDAKQLIAYLRKQSLGRVTFLPLEALRPRHLSDAEKKAIREEGALGIASELISCTDAQKAVDFLLGRTVVAPDSDTAIRVMRRCMQAFRTVTLEGDVFNAGGSITGGSVRRERSGLVSRDRRVDELKARADTLFAKTAELEEACKTQEAAHKAVLADMENLRGALHDCEVEAAAGRERREALSAAVAEFENQSSALRAEEAAISQSLEKLSADMDTCTALQSDIQQSNETKNEDYKRLEEQYNEKASKTEALRAQLHDAEVRSAELFRENASLVSDNLRLGLEKQEIERKSAARRKTLELNAESGENFKELKYQLERTRDEKAALLQEQKQQQGDMTSGRASALRELAELEARIEQARTAQSEASEKSMRTDFLIEKTLSDIEAAQNRLWDTHQLTYANALSLRADTEFSGAQAQAEEIRTRLRDLGSVNPAAIEEYAALKERMTSLTEQRDDLTRAEADLHKLIGSLLSEMRRTFRTSFEQINKHFSNTFRELFDGGRAELLLEEGEDIMECGIEIVAEPPGKKLQKISLLSGGEKALTAISLLFALLKLNPSPVCILDEIDAALDEANVRKFSEYLEKYAEKMQFIVITHRKPTMAVCESLFGFAMEEKGVSKLLSVRLDKENV